MDWFQNYWWVVLVAILLLAVAAVVVFARWLAGRPNLEFDNKIQSWDVARAT